MQGQSFADDDDNDDNDGDEPWNKEALHRYGLVRLWVRVVVGVTRHRDNWKLLAGVMT